MKFKKVPFWAVLLFMLGCSTAPTSRDRGSSPISAPAVSDLEKATPAENKEYRDIETLYNKNLNEAAISKIGWFKRKFSRSSLLPSIENLHGLLLLRNKKSTQAVEHFKKA